VISSRRKRPATEHSVETLASTYVSALEEGRIVNERLNTYLHAPAAAMIASPTPFN
jgi:hypothetical protein